MLHSKVGVPFTNLTSQFQMLCVQTGRPGATRLEGEEETGGRGGKGGVGGGGGGDTGTGSSTIDKIQLQC